MIHGLLHVEHQNVLMLAQRHPVGIEMARNTVLLPHEVIAPDSRLGKHEMRGEDSLGEQDDRTVRLDKTKQKKAATAVSEIRSGKR